MTLGGFAVALGVLVDDAIIGIENIMRRLRENSASPTPQPRLVVVRDASLEVRGPVIYATAVVIAVFLPSCSPPASRVILSGRSRWPSFLP